MTAKMSSNFVNYSDFISISEEALETAPRELFEKMMQMIISTLHKEVIERQKYSLEIDNMNLLPIDNLESYYDITLESIEDIKLLTKRITPLKNRDILFIKLYNTLQELHQSFIEEIDNRGQLEVHLLRKRKVNQ